MNQAEVLCHSSGPWKKHKFTDKIVKNGKTICKYAKDKTGVSAKEKLDDANTRYERTKRINNDFYEADEEWVSRMGWYDHLEHHGVQGQRWGVRRYQNYDGTWKAAGKNRNSSKSKKNNNSSKSKHEFHDYSKSQSQRSEIYGMLGLSAASLAMTTALNAATASAGYISGRALLAQALSAVGTVGYAGMAVHREITNVSANKKEKKFAEERAQKPIDKKTGFHKKTTEMTPEEDMERVNPGYKNWDLNTKNNCALCTMSYELRRRGYDVQARKATEGYDADALVKDWYKGAKPKQSEGSMSDSEVLSAYYSGSAYINKDRKQKMIENTMSEISKQPKNARGQITVIWDGTATGHSVAYAKENDQFVIYDTQANKKYEGKAAENYLNQCSQINVTRLDNCQVNTKWIKEVAE